MQQESVMATDHSSPSRWHQRLLLGLGVAGGLLLTGCAVHTSSPRVLHTTGGQVLEYAEGEQGYVLQQPPAPMQETITVRPSVNVVWMPGVWLWGGSSYYWRAGSWVRPPAGYYGWTSGYWRHTPRGYLWQNGYWNRGSGLYRHQAPRYRYDRDDRYDRFDRDGRRPIGSRPVVRPDRPDGVRPGTRPDRPVIGDGTRPNRPDRPNRADRPDRPDGWQRGERPRNRPDGVRPDRPQRVLPDGTRPQRPAGMRPEGPRAQRPDGMRGQRPEGVQRAPRAPRAEGMQRMRPSGMGSGSPIRDRINAR